MSLRERKEASSETSALVRRGVKVIETLRVPSRIFRLECWVLVLENKGTWEH